VRAKTIGIVGGMGPEATLALYGEILRVTPAQRDQDHLHVIIDSNPRIPDRTAAILEDGEDPVPAVVMACRRLERAGADFALMPCISIHVFLDRIRRLTDLPIISALDTVGNHIAMHQPPVTAVGLLAMTGVVRSGCFARLLARKGITTVVPDAVHQDRLVNAVYRIKGSRDPDVRFACRVDLMAAATHVIEKGAYGIIAGCTEIPLEMAPRDLPVPFFDPLAIMAADAVDSAMGGAYAPPRRQFVSAGQPMS
jgi:aspartate racemase